MTRAVHVLQFVNCFLSALGAALLYRVLRQVTRSTYLSVCLALLFAFSATWWKFSTDADSYIATTLLLVAAFDLLLPGKRPRPLAVALLHAAAMTFHQLAVFFFPVALLGIYFQTGGLPRRRRLFPVLLYSSAAFLLTVFVYYLCFNWRTGLASPLALLAWVTSYSSGSGGFSFRLLDNLTYTLRGHVRLFAGGRLTLLEGLLNPFLVALILLLAASVVALCYRLARFAGDLKRLSRLPAWPRTTRRVAALCAAWIVPPLVFCFFFYPSDTFHRLPYLPALVLLFGALLSRLDAARNFPRRARLALFVAALALANFCFYIYPYTHARNNPPLATALRMRDALAPGAVVFVAQSNGDNRLFRYFNRAAEWRTLRAGDFESLEREVREAAAGGREVWLETTAIARLEKLPGGREWLDARRARLTKIELVNDKFDIRYLRVA